MRIRTFFKKIVACTLSAAILLSPASALGADIQTDMTSSESQDTESAANETEDLYGVEAYANLEAIYQNFPQRINDENNRSENVTNAGLWIQSQLESYGYEVSTHDFTHFNFTGTNYFVTKPGKSDKTIIIGAHYDSMPTAGVDDNGSGVSVLLELAHRFYDMDTPCTLQFVFFDTEEYGAYAGSSCFVYTYLMTNNLLDDVLCCINIDSIAGGDRLYGYGGEYDEDGKLTREWVYDEANLIADDLGLDLYTLPEQVTEFQSPTRLLGSDSYYFAKEGIPYLYMEASLWCNDDGTGGNDETHLTCHYQTANEAFASTGGQILPPVMGSGAFLMVAFTEQKYIAIVIAAVIPALLYYWGCAVAVMSQTEIAHVTLMDPKDIPKSREVMKDGWIYLLIIAVLLYCLLVAQYSPLYSALWATCAVPVVMLFDKKKRFTIKTIPSAMVKSGFSAMSIVIGCACAGIVVGMVSITGIGVIFGDMMIQAAHGLLFPSLLFTAITCIVLGMGLPTTAAYVIAASILAPSLIKLGLAPLTAHLFVFYFACLSAITPPVALAAYAGAGIAKTNPMTTAVEACKLGFAGFMVPFAFCYNPAMMMQGSVGEIISVAISAIIGVAIMSAGHFTSSGHFIVLRGVKDEKILVADPASRKLNWLERIVFIAGGLLMFIPGTLTDIAGLVIAVALLLVNMKKWEKGPKFIMDKHKAKQEQK